MIPIVEIIKVKNPFDRTCREVGQVIFVPGKRLTEYANEPDMDYILNSNFVEQPELTYPSDGDQIVIVPHVGNGLKKILGTIASIMLMTYVGNIAGGLWTGGQVGLASYLYAGAVMAIGGRIINTMFGVKPKSLNADNSSSPTYGWDLPKPLTGEGNVIGITYGECIPAPQVLETHIDTVNDKQYLNILLCGGMGPIDEITDIKIGGNPIENYTDVQYDIRLGTNDQTVIPNFGDTTNNVEISQELSESAWATYTTDSDNGQGIQVTLEFPNGLYHLNDNGGLETAWITLLADYRPVGGEWKSWIGNGAYVASTSIAGATCYTTAPAETWTVYAHRAANDSGKLSYDIKGTISGSQSSYDSGMFDNGKIRFEKPARMGTYTIVIGTNNQISAAQNTAVRRSFRIDNLTAGKYEVRMKVAARSAPTTSTRDATTVYWTQLTSIMYADFCRPNKVLVGIRILATSQLSNGIPDITWRQKRMTVWIWNPETAQYETRAANNPIWATYDIYHQCRKLKNINTGEDEFVVFGVEHSRLDIYWHEWVEAAAYSDEQVPGLDGTPENRFEFDAFFDTEEKRYDAAQKAAAVGHATIIPRGNNIGIVCDKPGPMTQVFGEGRTTMSSLQGTFSGIDDRAAAVEVIFPDATNDFKNKQFMVRSPDWASRTAAQDNPAQLQLFGVKRKQQAYREGVYTLANNLMVTQFNDIGTDIDALVCQYGDIVGLNHSVSKIGVASGRLVYATASTVKLDKPVPLLTGYTYEIIVQYSADDTWTKKQVVPVITDTETDVLTVTQPFAKIPAQFDNYMFGETDKSVKPFRLVGVTKNKDLTCVLNMAEYVEGVYSGDLNYPLIDYTPPESGIFEVENLSLTEENYREKDGKSISVLHASWTIPPNRSATFIVRYSTDSENWSLWESTDNTRAAIDVTPLKTYYIKVSIVIDGIQSAGIIGSQYITGKDAPPTNIASLLATISQSDSTKITLNWPAVTDIDLRGYQIIEGSTVLTPTPISDTQYTYTATQTRQHTFSVRAVDNSGNLSATPATKTISITVEPANMAGFVTAIQETDRSKLLLSWTANNETDIAYYELRTGNTGWSAGTVIATQLKATSYTYQLTAEGSQTFMAKAVNVAGKSSITATAKTVQVILRPDAPVNFNANQDQQDRSVAILTWDASPGKDIEGYQIAVGSQTYFTRELSYRYPIPASGSYNFSIQAKTVAGYYSNAANTNITVMIEAYDVTNFMASQSMSDRTRVTLHWDPAVGKDTDHYIIKKGSTWDSATVIDQHVNGTFYDVIVTDETEQTFWIKAVTKAGKESQNPTSVPGIFNLNPDPVSNIQISQDTNDKSIVNITWTGISESDLTGYQVAIGYTWETAVMLPLTKELKTTYRPAATGDVKVIIKSVNAAGYYSDEVSEHYYATLEPLPVTGLVAYQNGETIELYWAKHTEPDVVSYEIREGANFEQGSLVATGVTQNAYVVKVDSERNYQYHIKAINRSGHYSQTAVSKAIFVTNLPVKNIIETFDEIALANGTHDSTEFGPSLINFSNIGDKFSNYPTTKFSDVGGQTVLKLKNLNIVSNGDFVSGVWGWTATNATISAGTGEGISTATALYGGIVYYVGSYANYKNHILYARAYLKSDNVNNRMVLLNDGTDQTVVSTTGSNTYEFCSARRTISNSATTLYVKTQDYRSSGWTQCRLKNVIVVDLTAMFGAGNEPTKDVCDTLFKDTKAYPSAGTYSCQRIDIGQVITANITTQFVSTVVLKGTGSAILQLRTSQDGTSWTDWQDFKPVQYTFRYADFRALLGTTDPAKTPEVNQTIIKIDVPDTDITKTVTVPVGGLTVLFGHTFYTVPVITPTAIGEGLHAELISKNQTNCVLKVKNASNTDVGGQADVRIKGY